MKILRSLLLLLLAAPALAQAPAAANPPHGFSAIGGAVFVGLTGTPQFGIGYPLAEWSSIFHRGHGTFVGLLGPDSFGLGLGHRFVDYISARGDGVSFTLGPAYTIKYRGCPTTPVAGKPCSDGLRSGAVSLFAVVSFIPAKKQ